ncbi:MAG: hypothetical protein NTX48_11720 [Planctomycetales bacterium]|nr:hypothetical protein [Planctomycetales bacterium]
MPAIVVCRYLSVAGTVGGTDATKTIGLTRVLPKSEHGQVNRLGHVSKQLRLLAA